MSKVPNSFLFFFCSLISLIGCEKKAQLTSDLEKYSYVLGYQQAENLKSQQIEIDIKAYSQALDDSMKGKESKISETEIQEVMKKMYEMRNENQKKVADENLKKGMAWLEENKNKSGIKSTESGLQYKIITDGEGAPPKPTDTVTIHYRGSLIDGKEFDSSFKRGSPVKFPLSSVISGWQEAFKMMNKGSKWQIFLPPNLGYGERGGPLIPPQSVLIFDLELIDISK